MRKILWVFTNCNTNKEAFTLGKKLLEQRLVACFDVFSRVKTMYYWPPQTGKLEKGVGAQLVLVTLPKKFREVVKYIVQNHSDQVPFVGSVEVGNVSTEYYSWLSKELI